MKSLKEKIVVAIVFAVIIAYTVLNVSISYSFFEFNNYSKGLKKNSPKQQKDNVSWIKTVDSIYTLSDNHYDLSMEYLNQLAKEKVKDTIRLKDIHYIKANIQYQNNHIKAALQTLERYNQFTKNEMPKYLRLKAGCLVRQNRFDEAEIILKKLTETDIDSKWFLGNFYEIKQDKQKAIECYSELFDFLSSLKSFVSSSPFHSKCASRIEALNQENPKYLNTIIYLDDSKRRIMRVVGRSFVVSQEF